MMFRIPLCVSLLLAASPLGYSMPANNAASPYLSKGGPISAREGSRVVLACNTEKIDGYINMWSFKNSQKISRTLFAGDIAIQQMAGVSLDKETGAVVIENMQPEFVGMFNCKISDPNLSDSIQYNLSIQTAPMIAPVPAQGKVSVRKEAPIFLRCNVQSDVPFSVQWTHQSKIIEDNAEVLEIPRASSVHEGKYTCIAKNEIGERSFSFDVEVEYEPEIKLSEKVIHGPIGDNVEVRCEVNAHPKADIAWYFGNNERVQKSRKHDITFARSTILLVNAAIGDTFRSHPRTTTKVRSVVRPIRSTISANSTRTKLNSKSRTNMEPPAAKSSSLPPPAPTRQCQCSFRSSSWPSSLWLSISSTKHLQLYSSYTHTHVSNLLSSLSFFFYDIPFLTLPGLSHPFREVISSSFSLFLFWLHSSQLTNFIFLCKFFLFLRSPFPLLPSSSL